MFFPRGKEAIRDAVDLLVLDFMAAGGVIVRDPRPRMAQGAMISRNQSPFSRTRNTPHPLYAN